MDATLAPGSYKAVHRSGCSKKDTTTFCARPPDAINDEAPEGAPRRCLSSRLYPSITVTLQRRADGAHQAIRNGVFAAICECASKASIAATQASLWLDAPTPTFDSG
jgi:hypothetical protein